GCYARSGLLSDVELYETYPARYSADASRRYRWVRGDWQIAQWTLSRVPAAAAEGRIANPLSRLSQWKIFDNLRRSLVPVALLCFLLGTWRLTPALAALGSLLVLAIVGVPGLMSILTYLVRKSPDLPWALHLRAALGSGGRQL